MKTKKMMFALLGMLFCLPLMVNCTINPSIDNPEESTDSVLVALTTTVPVTNNWIFENRPTICLQIANPNKATMQAKILVRISTDQKKSVTTIEDSVAIAGNEQKEINLSTNEDLAPGFYIAYCYVNDKLARRFRFGVNPFDIVSAPDMQADYDKFWSTAKEQLEAIDMHAELTEITTKSNSNCKAYLVEMYSVPDGLTGDPVIIRGYYLEPQDGQPHPVIMHFYGYDTQPNPPFLSCPSGDGKYAEFHLSLRGQLINNRKADKRTVDGKGDFENIYGDWFAYNFGDKDSYYYRGAFMDCVQAVRFMATRETSDMKNLFAEGSSQGGAMCYAAAALSDYPFSAIAPNVAFLGDFPDYFKIVSWPAETAKANKGNMTDEEMYAFLSYFDTKNLATKISCAVYATSGLQDETCPSHTNIAPFNNLKSTDKQMSFYPEMTHAYPPTWTKDIMAFFKAHIQ